MRENHDAATKIVESLRRDGVSVLYTDVVDHIETHGHESALTLLEGFGLTTTKNRVRNGGKTVQKRKKIASQKGFSYSSKTKRVVRIKVLEHLHRSRASKLSKAKRLSKKSISNIKRARSMRVRKMLGFDRR